MKAKFLFFALLSMLMASTILADPIELKVKVGGSIGHPRTSVPITASIENNIITTEVSTYSGTISVSIEDEDGETVISSAENVLPNSQFTTNVTSLDDGNYTIFYTLSDSTVYYGEFVK